MSADKQHEVIRDATLTFAHILKTHLPPRLESKNVDVYFEPPLEDVIEKAAKDGKAHRVPLSLILVEVKRSVGRQVMDEPIVREEDDDGNIAEYKLGVPTVVEPRYMVTPWCKDPLEGQVVMGAILQLFFDRMSFMPEDIQGVSIPGESRSPVKFDDTWKLDEQMRLWTMLQRPYRAGLVYTVGVQIDSVKKTLVRRVKERILDYKKLQG